MNKTKELLREYLKQANIMQLATARDNQPWACTVHYYCDDDFNLYWLSTEKRQHSQDIKKNPKAAAAIVVHENTPEENFVIGVSIEGNAEFLGDKVDEHISKAYTKKHNMNPSLFSKITIGDNPHRFYRLKPSKIILFDTKNFPKNPRQELSL